MKKTVTAHLSGTVFHIEEDAYEQLQRYLAGIRARFAGNPGAAEIMGDIENRIAELFTERMEGRRQVVTTDDVDHVIAVMGRPEDYEGAEETGAPGGGPATSSRRYRRLYRDPDDKWVAGVLGGVAAYFGIDTLVLRLIYIILLLLGVGWLLYLLLWLVVPRAETAAERLEMRGEPVNVENIRRMFEEGAQQVRTGARTMADEASQLGQEVGPRARRAGEEIARFFTELARLFLQAFGKVVGAFFLVVGGIALFAITIVLVGRFQVFSITASGNSTIDLGRLGQWLFVDPATANWALWGLALFVLIPVVGMILGGMRLVFDLRTAPWTGWLLGPLWIAAIGMVTVAGIRLGTDLRTEQDQVNTEALGLTTDHAVQLVRLGDDGQPRRKQFSYRKARVRIGTSDIRLENDTVWQRTVTLDIQRSPDSLFHLERIAGARGATAKVASSRAASVQGEAKVADSLVAIPAAFTYHVGQGLRGQSLHYTLLVPLGGSVFIDPSVADLLDDVNNVTNTLDRDMVGRTWTMGKDGLRHSGGPALPQHRTTGTRRRTNATREVSHSPTPDITPSQAIAAGPLMLLGAVLH